MSDPGFGQLIKRLERLKPLAVPFSTIGYRSTTPEYAKEKDILSGVGSKLHGGRWNPRGIIAVYLSLSPETAMKEALSHFNYYGLPPKNAMPRVFVAIQVQLQNVLDLTDGAIRQRIKLSKKRLLSTDWRKKMATGRGTLSQMLGSAVHASGFEALLVQSAEDVAGKNIVIFPDHFHKSSRFYLLDPVKLAPVSQK
jgi:RES domain-containing protein